VHFDIAGFHVIDQDLRNRGPTRPAVAPGSEENAAWELRKRRQASLNGMVVTSRRRKRGFSEPAGVRGDRALSLGSALVIMHG
jgi:hypothetical protein